MSEDFEIVSSSENQIDKLLQILAVLIERAGGEVVISRAEFEEVEGVSVVGRAIAKDYVRFRTTLSDEGSMVEVEEVDYHDS